MIRLTLLLALVWPGSGRPRKGYTPHPDVELYSVHFPVSVEALATHTQHYLLTGFVNNADSSLNITEIKGKLVETSTFQTIGNWVHTFPAGLTIDSANEVTLELPWNFSGPLPRTPYPAHLTATLYYEDEHRTYASPLANITVHLVEAEEAFEPLHYLSSLATLVCGIFMLGFLPLASPVYAGSFNLWKSSLGGRMGSGSGGSGVGGGSAGGGGWSGSGGGSGSGSGVGGGQGGVGGGASSLTAPHHPPTSASAERDPVWMTQYHGRFPSLKKVLVAFFVRRREERGEAEGKATRLAAWNLGFMDSKGEGVLGDGRALALLVALFPESKEDLVGLLRENKYNKAMLDKTLEPTYPAPGEKPTSVVAAELALVRT